MPFKELTLFCITYDSLFFNRVANKLGANKANRKSRRSFTKNGWFEYAFNRLLKTYYQHCLVESSNFVTQNNLYNHLHSQRIVNQLKISKINNDLN